MRHHLGLTGAQSKGLLARPEKTFDCPAASVLQHKFPVGEGQGIREEILGSVRFGMLVVLDQGKPSRPVS